MNCIYLPSCFSYKYPIGTAAAPLIFNSASLYLNYYLSLVMRKPVFALCEQQRRRSACASTQSDQRLCFRCLDSIIPLLAIAEISSLLLVSVAEQVSLSLTWSQTPKTGDEAHFNFNLYAR